MQKNIVDKMSWGAVEDDFVTELVTWTDSPYSLLHHYFEEEDIPRKKANLFSLINGIWPNFVVHNSQLFIENKEKPHQLEPIYDIEIMIQDTTRDKVFSVKAIRKIVRLWNLRLAQLKIPFQAKLEVELGQANVIKITFLKNP